MSCCTTLATIQAACSAARKTAKGFKRKLWIICLENVTAIPAATNRIVSTDLTLVALKFFYALSFDVPGQAWDVDPEGEGSSRENVLKAAVFIPGIDAQTSDVLNGIESGEFLVIIEDKNGNKRLIGEVDNGCSVLPSERNTDKNGHELNIEWTSAEKPLFYTGAIVIA